MKKIDRELIEIKKAIIMMKWQDGMKKLDIHIKIRDLKYYVFKFIL